MLFIKNVVFNSAFDKENEWSNLYGIKRHRNNIVISVTCESHLLSQLLYGPMRYTFTLYLLLLGFQCGLTQSQISQIWLF